MARSTRRRNREVRQKRLGVLMIAVVIAAVVLVLGYCGYREATGVELDPQTLCPTDRAPVEHVAVLIDASDPLSPVQQEFVGKYLRSLREQIPQYGKFSLYVLQDPRRDEVDPVISLCNPGDGRDASFIDQNPAMLRARWRDSFAEPLDRAIARTLDAPPADRSPIAEMITAVAVDAFPVSPGASAPVHGATGASAVRRLIVVSDLLQNSKKLSHYGRRAAELPELARSDAVSELLADLSEIDVTALYLARGSGAGGRLQGRDHVRYWEILLDRCGARLMEVRRVAG